jgi:beta-lactamase regulating signal transducer with metallopeptidase domain
MNPLEALPVPNEAMGFALLVAVGGAGVSAMAVALAALLRRRSEPLRYGVLLAGVIGLLAVPLLVGLGLHFRNALPWFAESPEDEIVRVPAAMLPELLNRPTAEAPEDDPTVPAAAPIGALLLAGWMVGSAIGVFRVVVAFCRLARAMIGVPWSAAFWTEERKAELARRLGMKRFPAVHRSPAAPMPMVMGLWRPTIVVPEPAPATWGQSQWEAVLLHEAAHIARRDPWAVLAERCAVIMFWWCPFVYVLARRLDALRESICDDWALQGTCDPIVYAELLVDSADHFLRLRLMPLPLGLLDSARGGLEARVTRLLAKEKPTMTRLSLSGKLFGAACLVAACLMTTAGTAVSGGQAAPPKKIQIKIIVDGKEIDLDDALLWQHIEAAQKKAAAEEAARALKALAGAKPVQNEDKVIVVKQLAFSPDGKLIAKGDGKHVIVLETATGKIVAQIEQPSPKDDPRIEALVKQAEAIKPGSGEQIRRALQAAPKHTDEPKAKDHKLFVPMPPPAGWQIEPAAKSGKKVIILQIEDGKVIQLNEAEYKKLAEKAGHLRIELDLAKRKDEKAAAAADWLSKMLKDGKADEAATLAEWFKKAASNKAANVPPAPAPGDLEALSRQIERLNAELIELRKRLDGIKK